MGELGWSKVRHRIMTVRQIHVNKWYFFLLLFPLKVVSGLCWGGGSTRLEARDQSLMVLPPGQVGDRPGHRLQQKNIMVALTDSPRIS